MLDYHLALYSRQLRAMGFHHTAANEWGSVWHRFRDDATAVMRRSRNFIPVLLTRNERQFRTDEIVREHLLLRNESLEDVA